MKKLFFFTAFLIASANSFAQSTINVQGYTTSNGTYVSSHNRTAPNNTANDNYSTIGNTNPYTGSDGTKSNNSGYSTYSTPSYTTPVYTGSRGGQYYINSNGNKSYISR